jgi:hypothetical protein
MSKEYNIYNNLLEAYKNAHINEELTFNCTDPQNELCMFLAAELVKTGAPNPIPSTEIGYAEYEDLIFFYNTWPGNKPNCAMKKRFLLAAYRLCKFRPDNIFEKYQEEEPVIEISLEDMKEKEYAETEREDIETETYVPVQEPKTILGVVPFDNEEEEDEKPKSVFKHVRKRNKA